MTMLATRMRELSDLENFDVEVVDANGTVVADATPAIKLTVAGPATLVGPNPINAEAGIASVLLQTGSQVGQITVTAAAEGLPSASGVILSKENVKPAVR